MATAKQLPSGSWRCRVYDKTTGKYVSFTSQLPGKRGKAEAELMARQFQLERRSAPRKRLTVGECIDKYIDSKRNILSPSTIDGYIRSRKNNLAQICEYEVSTLNSEQVQIFINGIAATKSPKTVKNAYGLLTAALNVYAPDLRLNVSLPKVQKKIKQLPPVKDVLRAVIGSEIELPCLLAMWLGLRMSEIRGAKKTDIKDGILTIHDTIVTVDGEHIEKHSTKTIDSTRQISLPERLQRLISTLPDEQLYLTTLSGNVLYKRFSKLLEDNHIEHMTFHELRHMNASVMVLLGIPDKYAMERGGWSSPHIMQSVYQHTFSEERTEVDKRIDEYFNAMVESL